MPEQNAHAKAASTCTRTFRDRPSRIGHMRDSVFVAAFRCEAPGSSTPRLPTLSPPCHPSLIGFYALFPDCRSPSPIISPNPTGADGKDDHKFVYQTPYVAFRRRIPDALGSPCRFAGIQCHKRPTEAMPRRKSHAIGLACSASQGRGFAVRAGVQHGRAGPLRARRIERPCRSIRNYAAFF